ncbi:MAG: hypothetical protein GPJ50_06095 [Candidatus Heimdallarchaeota archaeon]|nr:hypothetical protein [Candidatus Heimdallarchaeota archaeon]
MKFEKIVQALRDGERVRRKSWQKQWRIKIDNFMRIVIFIEDSIDYKFKYYTLSLKDLEATDWEIIG